ncbi:hypothetical protein GCM10010305_34430 [Streptomyces termitum]|uniref:Uncharacterized protein n=1 Tax=Streptomyces termitum TaxID=67368 RepID=A0A918T2F3_9ACTN|nr:hypothetical protein GCM10010305_34430 [Streptomyces termitum]
MFLGSSAEPAEGRCQGDKGAGGYGVTGMCGGAGKGGGSGQRERGRRTTVAITAGAVMRSIVVTGEPVLLGWGRAARR